METATAENAKAMNEMAERLAELHDRIFESRYRSEKNACSEPPLCYLGSSDIRVLCTLEGRSNPSIKEISEELDMPMSTLTGIFNKLVNKNLVDRVRCSKDRRIVHVNLTEKGREAAYLKKSASADFAFDILNNLNHEEQIQLIAILEKACLKQII
jgi:DNA-binding MarR family transcriptional regulator